MVGRLEGGEQRARSDSDQRATRGEVEIFTKIHSLYVSVR